MTARLRLLARLVLAALAGAWTAAALRQDPEPARTAFLVSTAATSRLRPGERCPECGHPSEDHDQDLGCLRDVGWSVAVACTCLRLGCLCRDRQR